MIFQNNSLEESFVISSVTVLKGLYYLFFLLKFISWGFKPHDIYEWNLEKKIGVPQLNL